MDEKGYTLVEVLVCVALAVLLIGSSMAAFYGTSLLAQTAKHRIEALQIVRGQLEELKVTDFDLIVNSTATVSYDPGPDGVFGNADDEQGTLTVSVADWLDMDSDGNTTETSVDINGGGNDPTAAKPVRVTFTWAEFMIGQTRDQSVFLDTLIAS
jgi:type II secretory pathway pseudopilin PulG